MLMSRETRIHCFLRAAALASNRRLRRRAVPENGFYTEGFEVHESPKYQAQPDGTFHFALLILDEFPSACVSRSHDV
eukprot:6280427-Pyramimonas_sp.AAC.1